VWLNPIRYGILRPIRRCPAALEPLVQPSEAAIADAVRALVGQR